MSLIGSLLSILVVSHLFFFSFNLSYYCTTKLCYEYVRSGKLVEIKVAMLEL